MSKLMKSLYLTCWLALGQLVGEIGTILGQINLEFLNAIDWSQLGWAFLGASAFAVWEIIRPEKPVKRKPGDRLGLIFVGMVISLGFGSLLTFLAQKTPLLQNIVDVPKQSVTVTIAFFGYTGLVWLFSGAGKRWFRRMVASAMDLEEKKEP